MNLPSGRVNCAYSPSTRYLLNPIAPLKSTLIIEISPIHPTEISIFDIGVKQINTTQINTTEVSFPSSIPFQKLVTSHNLHLEISNTF